MGRGREIERKTNDSVTCFGVIVYSLGFRRFRITDFRTDFSVPRSNVGATLRYNVILFVCLFDVYVILFVCFALSFFVFRDSLCIYFL